MDPVESANVHPSDRVENLVNRILNANSIFDNAFINQINANQEAAGANQWLDPEATALQAYICAMNQLTAEHLIDDDFVPYRKLYPNENNEALKRMVARGLCCELKRNQGETVGDHKLRLTRWARERLLRLSFSRS